MTRVAVIALAIGISACAPRSCGLLRTDRPPVWLVAEIAERDASLVVLEDDTLVLDAGFYVYALGRAKDAAVRPVGDPAAYASLLAADVPDARRHPPQRRTLTGTAERVDVDFPDGAGARFEGGRWSLHRAAVDPSEATAPTRRKEPDRALPPASYGTCEPVVALDGHAWARCAKYMRQFGSSWSLVRRDGFEWREVAARELDEPGHAVTVLADGTLWLGRKEARVTRRFRDFSTDDLRLPDTKRTALPAYGARWEPRIDATEVSVRELPVAPIDAVVQLVARKDGDVWILARAEGTLLLYRAGGERPSSVAKIGSEVDQRTSTENTAPPRRWIGHCAQVFVELGRARDGRLPALGPRADDLTSMLTNDVQHAFVVGTLSGARVAGLVLVRSRTRDEAMFEDAVSELVDRATTNPAAPPAVTCTLPVLERVES